MKRPVLLVAAALCLGAPTAFADGPRSVAPTPRYAQECGSCHVPYAPGLLGAESWQRLMANLPRHFGSDASLEPDVATEIGAWLAAHASRRATAPPPEDRITRSAWFQRKHREVAAAVWTRPSIRGASNCAACHGGAEQGDFDEDHVRIPH